MAEEKDKSKKGRPPGSKNKVGKDQKEFIKGLLGETQQEFRDAFIFYAKDAKSNKDSRAKFVGLSIELSKMIVPKPVDVDMTVNSSQFDEMMGIISKWDDETE